MMEKPDYQNSFDFYKCLKCGRLVTNLEFVTKLKFGRVCPCGGLKYTPIDAKWYQFFYPRVIWFAVQRLRGIA